MAKETINVIDIRSDKIICLVAQEIQLLDKGCLLYTSPSPRD